MRQVWDSSLEVSMCQCSVSAVSPGPTVGALAPPGTRLSVYTHGAEEALRHKWIESEKAGHDRGEAAIREWIQKHWNGFLRARWLEHLQGKAFWIELDQHDFGLLQREFRQCVLIDPILTMLKNGSENLNVLTWAQDKQLPMPEVITILESLDINSRRLEFKFSPRIF